MVRFVFFLFLIASFVQGEDIEKEFLKEQIKSVPLNKAVIVGKGKERVLVFMNPDCPHCRKEWQELKGCLHKLRLYVFLVPFPRFPESYQKSAYVVCSKNHLRALDEVLSGKWDQRPLPVKSCPLLKEHERIAKEMGVSAVPYNILLRDYTVVSGYSPDLRKKLSCDR
ncbi:hypothetical protein Thal_0203 [Thermocrinis albus DSM 14484]|uniref:Thioredoxin-like fold domain-containing protein n=1 Tax=Thermocrinis albus (strain DSM 14484 / JCM 11386 / HI 11/12) TaxID=638303 RepID=D3SNV1_THEAH|nr:DsbC family protein [Thermocrinis albus]ADC88838.1 hypothetical protein Thal_0203 [Thermocrinis albus DSM 14484]